MIEKSPSAFERPGRVIIVSDILPYTLYSSGEACKSPSSLTSDPGRPKRRIRTNSISPRDNISRDLVNSQISNSTCINGTIEVEQRQNNFVSALVSHLNRETILVGKPNGCQHLLPDVDGQCRVREILGTRAIPVFIDQERQSQVDNYCRALLWPMMHYVIWDFNQEAVCNQSHWSAYVKSNEEFCNVVLSIFEPGDMIWILDYQLLLLPAMLRAKLDSATISFYLRAPFPTSELFRCLPEAKELLLGMLGANVIGFQTYSYARHFLSSCTRILGHESSALTIDNAGVPVNVVVKPIGVDWQQFSHLRTLPTVSERFETYQHLFAGKKIILGIETTDQSRGIVHKLKSFELFLQLYPDYIGTVALVQVVYGGTEQESKFDPKINELISNINGTYGSLDFHPVHFYQQALDSDEYFALITLSDILIMTSERDTVNSILLEYIACQDERHGIPIFSEFIGLSDILPSGFRINPWDHRATAEVLHEALSLTAEERAIEYEQLGQFVRNNSLQNFVASFMEEIASSSTTFFNAYSPTPMLGFELILEAFTGLGRRLILLDYDGTLTPIHRIPSAATPTQEVIRLLRLLTSDSRNHVYIISGRDQTTLEEWLGNIPRLGMSAEHGCFIRPIQDDNCEAPKWISVINVDDLSWKNDVIQIMEYYTERTPGSFVEFKNASLTWHYRLSDPDFGSWQSKGLQTHLELTIASKYSVEIICGKKNLEVRPKSCNKGEIVRTLLERHGRPDFVFCAGDDRTDEDMFRALLEEFPAESPAGESCFTCCIGASTKKTMAKYRVNTPEQVVSLLLRLCTFATERSLGVTL